MWVKASVSKAVSCRTTTSSVLILAADAQLLRSLQRYCATLAFTLVAGTSCYQACYLARKFGLRVRRGTSRQNVASANAHS